MMGIEYAASLGFRIKLNVVVLRGVNDGEVIDLADFALSRGFDITYIEEMPLGKIDSHQRNDTQFFSELIRQQIALRYVLTPVSDTTGGPARYCAVEGQTSKIGFISPLSNNFCGDCNRVRLTAEGKLLLCLGNDHSLDLKALIRRYPGEHDQLRSAIVNAMTNKPEKHHFDPERVDIVRFMNMTGG
jgi:cyclic pyranopterin phosphate synthase